MSVEIKIPGIIPASADGLLTSQVQLFEDDQEIPVQSVEKERRGVYFTLAINGARELDLRDTAGVSNYDKLRAALRDWALANRLSDGDAWSLETNKGRKADNALNAEEWLDALDAYEPEFRTMKSDMTSLEAAIRSAADRVLPFGVDRAILYITTPPSADQIKVLNTLEAEARSAGIRVSVWMVGEAYFLKNEQGGALISLADGTGGSFFHFSGTEPFPNLDSLHSNLGVTYRLQYESNIRQSGTYPLKVAVSLADGTYQGEGLPFYIEVRPPKPVLVAPPTSIQRGVSAPPQITSGAMADGGLGETLQPDSQIIVFQVDFPDGYPRQIVASRLIVNGVVVAINDAPPFTDLSWDLSDYVETGEQIIQVEVSDSLGLSGLTNEYPVKLVVDLPESAQVPAVNQIGLILAVVLLGLGVLSLLVWGSLRIMKKINLRQVQESLLRAGRKAGNDEASPPANPMRIYATLLPTGILDEGWEEQAIRVTKRDGVFGTKTDQVDYPLLAGGADGIQARLTLRSGEFWLQDLDSTLGTWVNYTRIGTEPVSIHPGDVVHFGNCGFRFTMIDKSLNEKVRFAPYEPLI